MARSDKPSRTVCYYERRSDGKREKYETICRRLAARVCKDEIYTIQFSAKGENRTENVNGRAVVEYLNAGRKFVLLEGKLEPKTFEDVNIEIMLRVNKQSNEERAKIYAGMQAARDRREGDLTRGLHGWTRP